MQTAPLPLPDKLNKLSIVAPPFANIRGGLEQEFSADGKRHRCDHDFSVQSVAGLEPSAPSFKSFRISAIRLLNSTALNGFRSTGISDMPLLRSASAYPVMSNVLRPG